jgi:serine/threonine-protein phosphatase 6 regulatory ankyrin repeat subunit B
MSQQLSVSVQSTNPALIMELTGTAQCHADLIAGMSEISRCLFIFVASHFVCDDEYDCTFWFVNTVSGYECATCSAVNTTRSDIVASGHGQCFTAYTMQVQRNERPDSDASPSELAEAAGSGHDDMVLALLDAGVDVNQADDDDTTAILMASACGHQSMVDSLLSVDGIDVNKATKDGTTALFLASGNGHQSVVDSLLAVDGIDVNKANTPLCQSALVTFFDAILQPDKATIDCGMTPLWIACANKHQSIVDTLLAADGIDVNKGDADGMTALFVASCSGHHSVVDSLLAVDGIDVNKARTRIWTGDRTDDGSTPLFAVSFCFKVQLVFIVVFYLISMQFSLFLFSCRQACEFGHVEVVKRLLAAGASVSITRVDGCSCAKIANDNGHDAVATILTSLSVNPNDAKSNEL